MTPREFAVPAGLLAELSGAREVLVASHENPDADGIGSALALAIGLERMGKRVARLGPPTLGQPLDSLPGLARIDVDDGARRYDLAVLFDCHRRSRLGEAAPVLERAGRAIAIDHHPLAAPTDLDLVWIEESAASSSLLVWSVLRALGHGSIDPDQAGCIYAGLLTDTGGFRHEGTDAAVLAAAADLVAAGADPVGLARSLLHRQRPESLRLLAESLLRIHYDHGGAIAWVVVDRALLERTGAQPTETEGIISYLTALEGVSIAILLREHPAGTWRVSLRGLGTVAVDGLARSFGGGGHRRAAAFSTEESLGSLRPRLVCAARDVLDAAGRG